MSGLRSSILIDGTLGSNSRGVPGTRGGPRWVGWVHRPHVVVGCHVALASARFENWTARAAIGQADLGIGPRRVPHLRPVFQKSPIIIWPAGFLLRPACPALPRRRLRVQLFQQDLVQGMVPEPWGQVRLSQACPRCRGRDQYAAHCDRNPRLCGSCCRLAGWCPWHQRHSVPVPLAIADQWF